MYKINCGFSLIELLIAMAIIGILSSIALPSYQHYLKRARYQEIVHATLPYQLAVEECFQIYADLSYCSAHQNNLPPNFKSSEEQELIDTITLKQGVITVTPKQYQGIQPEDTYQLTPTTNALQQLRWKVGGGALQKGLVR